MNATWPLVAFGLSSGALIFALWQIFWLRRENRRVQGERAAFESRAIGAEARGQQLAEQLAQNRDEAEKTKSRLQLEIENFNRKWLDESQNRMQKWSQDNLASMVKPVDEGLKSLQARIQDVYDKEARERLSLKAELEFMFKAQQQMSLEAQSLTKALRGDVRAQGHWGEIILERILESSGLREGEEYVVQGRGLGLKAGEGEGESEGATRKPDVLVRLPGERHLIIDSKVSLSSYEAHIRADSDGDRQAALADFVRSVRRHVEELAGKDYPQLYGLNSPDFVLMFVPTDGAFSVAHQADPQLFALAMEKRIAIVSPSLLFPNLRTVEAIWRQERQNRNAEEIARQAGGLYDKFAGLLDDLNLLTNHLRKADETRADLMNKLRDGRGNLIDRVEKLRLLGARTKKRLLKEKEREAAERDELAPGDLAPGVAEADDGSDNPVDSALAELPAAPAAVSGPASPVEV
jgi:DNA recombination protein RmuC